MTRADMSDDQEKAMAWLRGYADNGMFSQRRNASTILAMLAEPRLPRPEDVPVEMLVKMYCAWCAVRDGATETDDMREAYRALYDHYTAPRTKTVEVWHCESAVKTKDGFSPHVSAHRTRALAEKNADALRKASCDTFACIRVTGPHQQEVPADDDAR